MNPTHVMGRRVVAFIVDGVLLTAVFAGLFFALANHTDQAVSLTGTNLHITFNNDTYYLEGGDASSFYVVELLVGLLYGGVIQGLTGRTIGKLICGIRVVREDGSTPGIGRGVLRWVLLIVDDFPYFIPMLTGFIVALTNDRRQREEQPGEHRGEQHAVDDEGDHAAAHDVGRIHGAKPILRPEGRPSARPGCRPDRGRRPAASPNARRAAPRRVRRRAARRGSRRTGR